MKILIKERCSCGDEVLETSYDDKNDSCKKDYFTTLIKMLKNSNANEIEFTRHHSCIQTTTVTKIEDLEC